MPLKKVKDLKKNELFLHNMYVGYLVRGSYVRELKKYSCTKYDDINCEIFVRGDKSVLVD